MIVYGETGERIGDFDLEAGCLEERTREVLHEWVVDSPEEGEWEIIAEYPETGGQDVEWRVTRPEEGHWETRDAVTREPVPDFDGTVPADAPHDKAIPDVFRFATFRPYTEDELKERAAEEEERRHVAKVEEQARAAVPMLLAAFAPQLADAQALAVDELFTEWQEGVSYSTGAVCRHGGHLWRCLQAHDAQADWEPGVAPSLWVEIAEPGTVPDWKQPTGAHDAYAKGDKVKHGGSTWVSAVDANVWEPGVHGWERAD